MNNSIHFSSIPDPRIERRIWKTFS